jgi:transcriptional regulator with XRE-family HTH domain
MEDPKMTEMEIVAKNMRMLRTQQGLTQAKLAEKVGITEQTIYLYERAERTMPLDKLGKVAFALGLSRAMDLLNENLEAKLTRTEDTSIAQAEMAALFADIRRQCAAAGLDVGALLTGGQVAADFSKISSQAGHSHQAFRRQRQPRAS